jgi:hypothetical protein
VPVSAVHTWFATRATGTLRDVGVNRSVLERPTGAILTFDKETGALLSLTDKYNAEKNVTLVHEMVDDITTTAATNASVPLLRLVRDETTGAVLDVAHDSKGRISTVVMSVPGTPEVNTTATYTYDSNGCLVGVVVGGGDATALTWAAPHQLALVSSTDGVASRFTYEAGTGFAVQRTRTDNTLQRMSGLGVPYSHVHDAGTVPIVFPAFPETPSLWPGSELFAGMPNASVHALLDKDFYVSGLSAGSRSQLLTNSGFGFNVHRVESSLSSLTQTYVCRIHSPCLHAAKRLPICWLLSLPHFCASAPSQQSACLLLRFDSLGLTRLHTSDSVSRRLNSHLLRCAHQHARVLQSGTEPTD